MSIVVVDSDLTLVGDSRRSTIRAGVAVRTNDSHPKLVSLVDKDVVFESAKVIAAARCANVKTSEFMLSHLIQGKLRKLTVQPSKFKAFNAKPGKLLILTVNGLYLASYKGTKMTIQSVEAPFAMGSGASFAMKLLKRTSMKAPEVTALVCKMYPNAGGPLIGVTMSPEGKGGPLVTAFSILNSDAAITQALHSACISFTGAADGKDRVLMGGRRRNDNTQLYERLGVSP